MPRRFLHQLHGQCQLPHRCPQQLRLPPFGRHQWLLQILYRWQSRPHYRLPRQWQQRHQCQLLHQPPWLSMRRRPMPFPKLLLSRLIWPLMLRELKPPQFRWLRHFQLPAQSQLQN